MHSEPVVAVTGASGYVGSLLTDALAKHARVVSLVRTPKKTGDRIWSFDMTAREMTDTLRDMAVTHIIHAAWDMRAGSLQQLNSSCVAGTGRLIAAAAATQSQVIFISTISAFDGARSAYGKAKLAAEKIVIASGGLVLRLGLVCADRKGGMFGTLAALASRFPVLPLIRGGSGVQFLLHERSLTESILRAIRGDFADGPRIVTLADPNPVRLADLMVSLGADAGRKVLLFSVPWWIPYVLLRCAEMLRLSLPMRSDSLVSFVYQNPKPDFAPLLEHDIDIVSPVSSYFLASKARSGRAKAT